MKEISFYKYQGTGNDFVMIDNRNGEIKLTTEEVAFICDRRFGVGADGLILLELEDGFDFKMVYYNSDGHPSTMCGNGGRCLVQFANDIGVVQERASFIAVDGPHEARIENNLVHLKMLDAQKAGYKDQGSFIDTGSPHHVVKVASAEATQVFEEGRRLRNEVYGIEGANINFVEVKGRDTLIVRTYERGVEDETYSCGTGVTASALIAFQEGWVSGRNVDIQTLGGDLKVQFSESDAGFKEVYLIGPAKFVFKGEMTV